MLPALLSVAALASDPSTPHPHQGELTPITSKPSPIALTAAEKGKLAQGAVVQRQSSGEDGGSGRSWGERWSERWGSYASHGRQGEREGSTWNDRDGHKFTKDWGEEHWPDGRVRKYGHSSDGSDHWDVWEDSDGWWERHPSFGWAEAVTHSPQLMSIKPRKAKGSEKKKKKK